VFTRTPHPPARRQCAVVPAIPLFGLKKALLGKTHTLFAGLLAHGSGSSGSSGGGGCKGPLCALLPMLPLMNVTLDQVQV
jgi:hypothetical protein